MESVKIILYIIFVLLAIYVAARFTLRRAYKIDSISLVMKALSSVCFIVLGFVAFYGSKNATSIAVLAGLCMGLVGDIFLDLKMMYYKGRETVIYTFTGFFAFILGHICYLMFMFHQYGPYGKGLWISLIVGIMAGVAIYMTPNLMRLNYGQYHVISSAYAALLVFVTVYSAFLCFHAFSAAKLLFFIGLLFFLISDLILSQIYFGKNKMIPENFILNHGTYYLAQILIAASIMFV